MELIVASCFKYRDAWKPFCRLLKKFWPDCPYKTRLITDKLESGLWEGDSVTEIGKDFGWGQNLLIGLEGQGSHVLLFQEDFFLTAPVWTSKISDYHKCAILHSHVGCLRLYPCPGADSEWPSSADLGIVSKYQTYRISCQVAIWRTDYLKSILARFNDPRDFEVFGSHISNLCDDVVLSVYREHLPWPVQYLCSAIGRGRWSKDAVKLCSENNLELDLKFREVE